MSMCHRFPALPFAQPSLPSQPLFMTLSPNGDYVPCESSNSTAWPHMSSYGPYLRDAATNPLMPILSARGLFCIHGYRSIEGDGGKLISIVITFKQRNIDATFLRLVLGRKALTTIVRQIGDQAANEWKLEAMAPPLDEPICPSTPIPLSIQALNHEQQVIDSLVVGNFTYRSSSESFDSPNPPSPRRPVAVDTQFLRDSIPSTGTPIIPSSRRSPSTPEISSSRSRKPSKGRPQKQTIVRTRRISPGEVRSGSQRVLLNLITPVETFTMNWTEEEKSVGRRLIRFTSRQEGQYLKAVAEHIQPEEYRDGDAVISCIYRRYRDKDVFNVTSVDIIFLLEHLVRDNFEIEEKNRIRRNLEGFRPLTISRNKPESGGFFQRIMDFPSPKPRHIEKDVKVFDWDVLPQALEKIISKYSLCPMSPDPNLRETEVYSSSSSTRSSASPYPQFTPIRPDSSSPELHQQSIAGDYHSSRSHSRIRSPMGRGSLKRPIPPPISHSSRTLPSNAFSSSSSTTSSFSQSPPFFSSHSSPHHSSISPVSPNSSPRSLGGGSFVSGTPASHEPHFGGYYSFPPPLSSRASSLSDALGPGPTVNVNLLRGPAEISSSGLPDITTLDHLTSC